MAIKTLALRMEQVIESTYAMALAQRLADHRKVERVFYPGLADHPQHALAQRQMNGFGGIVSVELAGGIDAVGRFMNALEIFTLAESLGGVESLAGHPATMSHSNVAAGAASRTRYYGQPRAFVRGNRGYR